MSPVNRCETFLVPTRPEVAESRGFLDCFFELTACVISFEGSLHKPRVVQIVSPPYDGTIHFGAGAAQFGLDISNKIGVGSDFKR